MSILNTPFYRLLWLIGKLVIYKKAKKEHEMPDQPPVPRHWGAIFRGDVVWNTRTGQWEKRVSQNPLSWRERILGHWWNDRSDLPSGPPPDPDSLPTYEPPGGLSIHQLQRIDQLNDLAERSKISDAVRDEEIRQIMRETHR